jgi:hypothetical protein
MHRASGTPAVAGKGTDTPDATQPIENPGRQETLDAGERPSNVFPVAVRKPLPDKALALPKR